MSNFPQSILEFMLHLTVEHRTPAYLAIDEAGQVHHVGGNLARYGLSTLDPDHPIQEQLLFLEGILPQNETPVFFPCVETHPGVFADIHIFQREALMWVLLLDTTREANWQREVQQKLNDLSRQQRQSRPLKVDSQS